MVLCKGAICDLVTLIFRLSKLAMGIANGSRNDGLWATELGKWIMELR